jgi:inorganic pyrophosphatase
MKSHQLFFTLLSAVLLLFSACKDTKNIHQKETDPISYLHDIAAFTSDSLVQVVIEIPAGTNQKWEVNKETGQIEWERVTPDSMRIIDYLAYPANYGFVPQTLLSNESGGDGDPVDVFVLGPSIAREQIVKVRIVGIIHMLDAHESDSKLLAVDVQNSGFDAISFEMLQNSYPGAVDIIRIWLTNYKRTGGIEIISVKDEKDAFHYLKTAHDAYIDQQFQK